MRKYLKKTGLTSVILISLAAIAILPKNISQWVVLATIAGLSQLKTPEEVARNRGKSIEEIMA